MVDQRQWYRLADDVKDIILETDQHLILTFLNIAWEKQTGFTVKDSLGTPLTDFLCPPGGQQTAADLTALTVLKDTPQIVNLKKADGSCVPYTLTLRFEEAARTWTGIISENNHKISWQNGLEASGERYQLLADNALDIVTLFSTDGTFYYISPSVTKILGYTTEEYAKFNSYENAHPEDRQRLMTSLEEIKTAQDQHVITFRIKNKQGSYVWLEGRSRLIEYDAAKDTGIILSMSRDVSAQKWTEISLRESEYKYRLLAENVSDVITLFNVEAKYVYVSPSVERFLGYTSEEMLQKMPRDVMRQPYLDQAFAAHRNRQDADEIISTETEYIRKDGTTLWGENTTSTLRDEEGNIMGYLVTTRNIDKRKKAEQALKYSEETLKEAQKIASIGSYEYDLISRKITWSDELYHILGMDKSFTPNEVALENLVHPADKKRVVSSFFKSIDQTRSLQQDYRIVRPDGRVIHVLGINRIISNEEGKPVKAIGIIQDITGRKRAENRIEKQNEELRKLNQELDQLIYSSSHDLRSPLASALGLLAVIQIEKDEAVKENYLKLMEKSLQRLDNFTRDILDLYKNARSAPDIEPVDVQKIVEDILEGHKFMEGANQIEKTISISQPATFYSEKRRLGIIFSNLISNAIRYHNFNQTQPFIEISGTIDKDRAVLYIKDNGQGIQKEHIDKVFDMFYRAHHEKKGSGLGLYLVRETVEKLRGNIQITSEYEKGTIFTLTLPNLASERR